MGLKRYPSRAAEEYGSYGCHWIRQTLREKSSGACMVSGFYLTLTEGSVVLLWRYRLVKDHY